MTKVLIIETNIKSQLSLKLLLTYRGFDVTVSSNLINASKLLSEASFQLIIADIHNHQEDMFNFIKMMRLKGVFTPIIYLGERAYRELMQKRCSGLDEYLTKPYQFKNLSEVIQRSMSKTHSLQKPLLYGGIIIDEKRKIISVKEKIISLGRMETKILALLAKKAGRIVSIENLYSLYESENITLNSRVYSYVSNLRKKLEDAGIDSIKINFVRNGYRLDVL